MRFVEQRFPDETAGSLGGGPGQGRVVDSCAEEARGCSSADGAATTVYSYDEMPEQALRTASRESTHDATRGAEEPVEDDLPTRVFAAPVPRALGNPGLNVQGTSAQPAEEALPEKGGAKRHEEAAQATEIVGSLPDFREEAGCELAARAALPACSNTQTHQEYPRKRKRREPRGGGPSAPSLSRLCRACLERPGFVAALVVAAAVGLRLGRAVAHSSPILAQPASSDAKPLQESGAVTLPDVRPVAPQLALDESATLSPLPGQPSSEEVDRAVQHLMAGRYDEARKGYGRLSRYKAAPREFGRIAELLGRRPSEAPSEQLQKKEVAR